MAEPAVEAGRDPRLAVQARWDEAAMAAVADADPAQIMVAVQGRFHAFYLARELQTHGALHSLVTSYPTYDVVRYGIQARRTVSLPSNEAIPRAWRRGLRALPEATRDRVRSRWTPQALVSERLDRFAARHLSRAADRGQRPDVVVAWSGSGLETLTRAKALGAVAVCERGSSHMRYQQRILRDEFARWGLPEPDTHPRVVERELEEYALADRIAVPSLYVERTFLEEGVDPAKLVRVPYGVDLREFQPEPRPAEDLDSGVFRVMHCGGLSVRKGLPYLLAAFHGLDLPQSELWLVGPVLDEAKPFLAQYGAGGPDDPAPAGRRSRIVVHGSKPQTELRHYYKRCDLAVLASLEEGLAMVQVQALACGLPLLCTTNTGGEGIVRDGVEGFVVPIRDPEALAAKMAWAHAHRDEARAMGQAGLARVRAGFSWADYGRRLHTRYAALSRGRVPCVPPFPPVDVEAVPAEGGEP